MGEDIGVYEGTFRITAGMLKKYGPKRVIDTPIAEAGMAGTAVGMAMLGLRPIVEMMTMNFAIVAADQILNHAAKVRYFSGGQVDVPMVIRGPQGAGVQLSAQHSQTFESFYAHFPGIEGRRAGDAGRREGNAEDRDPRTRSGDLPRERRALRHEGRGAGRSRLHRALRRVARRARGDATSRSSRTAACCSCRSSPRRSCRRTKASSAR